MTEDTMASRYVVNDLRAQRMLVEAEQIAALANEWQSRERDADEARRQFEPVASIYIRALLDHGPGDMTVIGLHAAMVNVYKRAHAGVDLPGVDATDPPEAVRVVYALSRGAESVRVACALSRAAAVVARDRREAKRILAERPDAPDGGLRSRIRKSGVVERWLNELRLRVQVINGFVSRGEWSSENRYVVEEQARLSALLARHGFSESGVA